MKTKFTLLVVFIFTMANFISGQPKETVSPVSVISAEDIFKQGVWNFSLDQSINFITGNSKVDGEKTGTFGDFDTRLEANYFFVDNFAVGLGFRMGSDKTTSTILSTETIEQTNVLGGYFNALYGTRVGGVINIITKATAGMGQVKFINDDGFGENESKDKYFTWGVSAGTPLKLNRNVYFTPTLGYNYRKTTWDDNKEVQNSFNVGLQMDFFMGCGDDRCELSKNPLEIDSNYRRGDMELGSAMFGGFQLGSQKTTYVGDGEYEQKDGFGNSRLSGFFRYYVTRDFAVGAGLDYFCDRTNSKDSDYKTRQSELTINPLARYHLPMDNSLRNLFIDGAVGIGFNNSKTINGDNETKDNASVFQWKIGAGYDYFVAEHFSLVPMIGYGGQTLNYKDDDYKSSKNGLIAGIGWTYHLR